MKQFTCLILEDEPLATAKLVRFIEKEGTFEIAGKCANASEAQNLLGKNKVDLLFFDIRMPGVSGIEFAMKRKITTPIIFTTAYDEYAIKSFDLNVIDYLLKPYSYARFVRACTKVKEFLSFKENRNSTQGCIFINSEHQVIKLNFDEIIYIEGLKDYVKIFTTVYEKPILTRQNLKKMESQLPGELFLRVHRSYIVCVDKIQALGPQHILLNNISIPVGDNFKPGLLKLFYE